MVPSPDSIRIRIAKRLRAARKQKGYSQRDLGLLTGLSDKSISAYEKAKVTPPVEVLARLAEELEKPISYFVEEELDAAKLAVALLQRLKEQLRKIEEKVEYLEKLLKE